MSFDLVIDLMGFGVIFWAIGRLCFHLALLDFDNKRITRKSRVLYILTFVFYILGNFSSLIIGGIDGMCHKRLFHKHLEEMRKIKSYVPFDIKKREEFEKVCEEYGIGRYDIPYPMDIPFLWYTLY